ncbi:hypothetical protein HMI55_005639 [Coelomomyces lativittatus]|nr:hypothetical protein HMI55_005639 [Coelomomyces lativittatus]
MKQGGQPLLGVMDVEIARNAYTQCFTKPVRIPMFEGNFPGVFIRAPQILRIGENVQVLSENELVAVRQGHLLGTTFHPELTDDIRMHLYFLNMVELFRSHVCAFE